LIATLTALAEARQAAVSDKTLELYAENLSEFELEAVRAVVRRFATSKRAEYETAFPILGDLVEPLKAMRERRREEQRRMRIEAAEVEEFWSWVSERMADWGQTEQEVLDGIKAPGLLGLKVRALRARG
jgi:hypothetical protein